MDRYRGGRIKRALVAAALVLVLTLAGGELAAAGEAGAAGPDAGKALAQETLYAAGLTSLLAATEGLSVTRTDDGFSLAERRAVGPAPSGEGESWLAALLAAGFIGTVYARRVIALQRM
ncbi:hypothetical protein WMW72_07700 [Paenibacillus filicis]|uniref:Uncharacterized protein n=1 Tax=Paenibacillus filicis TaxID=669464 RepID=A0ABU9DHQ6_9BACL